MKLNYLIKTITCAAILLATVNASAQKAVIAVLNFEAVNVTYSSDDCGNLFRLEVEKTDQFEVINRQDLRGILSAQRLKLDTCFGKSCIIQAANLLNANKALSGSIENYGKHIIIIMRLFNVKDNSLEKSQVLEFQNIPEELPNMIHMSVRKFWGLSYNELTFRTLSKEEAYESEFNNPGVTKLVLSGPRTGFIYLGGQNAKRLTAPKTEGGFGAYPFMTMFGYQKEFQYLNSGNFQALFEFIPAINGLDQGLVSPSMTFLHGFRSNRSGWEFAFGPTISLVPKSEGFYYEGKWTRVQDWDKKDANGKPLPIPTPTEKLLDARGALDFSSGFVFAVGKSFKSGRVNMPVNMFVVPSRDNWHVGVTFGFNAKRSDYSR
jgi:hypothetical protein